MTSKRQALNYRLRAVGLWKRHCAGATVRELAELTGKTPKKISALLKIGERFSQGSKEST